MSSSSDTHAPVEAQNLGRLAGEPKKVKAARRTDGALVRKTAPKVPPQPFSVAFSQVSIDTYVVYIWAFSVMRG
jgi:hypothetical protein